LSSFKSRKPVQVALFRRTKAVTSRTLSVRNARQSAANGVASWRIRSLLANAITMLLLATDELDVCGARVTASPP
jgi:hypothetical protein